jgi:hypothetical protein
MLANGAGRTGIRADRLLDAAARRHGLLSAFREKWPCIKGAIMTGNPQESLRAAIPASWSSTSRSIPRELRRCSRKLKL